MAAFPGALSQYLPFARAVGPLCLRGAMVWQGEREDDRGWLLETAMRQSPGRGPLLGDLAIDFLRVPHRVDPQRIPEADRRTSQRKR